MIILVTIRAIGVTAKGLKKTLDAMSGKHSVVSLEKPAARGPSYVRRKVQQSETGSPSGGDSRWFKKRSTREQRPVTDITVMMMMMMIMMIMMMGIILRSNSINSFIKPEIKTFLYQPAPKPSVPQQWFC